MRVGRVSVVGGQPRIILEANDVIESRSTVVTAHGNQASNAR